MILLGIVKLYLQKRLGDIDGLGPVSRKALGGGVIASFEDEEEHKAVIKACVEEMNGANPVIIVTGRASSYETIKMSQYAQSVGANGIQVIHPYYFVSTVEGMFQHYRQVAQSVDVGLVVYNNPAFSQA